MTSYCLFWNAAWCLPSSDWAAWVQAFGSIAAIGAAIWISHSTDRRATQKAVAMLDLYMSEGMALIQDLERVFSLSRAPDDFIEVRKRFEDLITWSDKLPAHLLPSKKFRAYFQFRSVAAATLVKAQGLDAMDIGLGVGAHRVFFNNALVNAERASRGELRSR